MDFIEILCHSNDYQYILVLVNRMMNYAYFIQLKHIFSTQPSTIECLQHIIKLYRIPYFIVFDHEKFFLN